MPNTTAFVTGASRGIGKAIAIALAEKGYDVAISARTVNPGESRENTLSVHKSDTRPLPGSLSETKQEIEARGVRCLALPMDLLDLGSVGAAGQALLERWGGVDVLVHNGRHIGPGLMDTFLDTPTDAYAKFFEAHCVAPIVLTKMLLPRMLERGKGVVMTTTSNAAYEPPPGPAGKGGWGLGYAVGKASGHPLAWVLNAEFKDRGIRTYNVQPGFVATERNHMVAQDVARDISMGAPPAAIGAVVAYLLTSEEGAQLSGEVIQAQAFCLERNLHPSWK
jgi:NAD(P)-dependent dehydrogenase (short-subunit alcohol dehydrogenase family)